MKDNEIIKMAKKYADDKADKGNYDYAVGDSVYFCKSSLEKAYIAGGLDVGNKLKKEYKILLDRINELEEKIRLSAEREAQDIRARFPC